MPIKVSQLNEYTSTINSNSNVVFLIVDTDANVTRKVKANNIQFASATSGFTGSIGPIGYTGSQGIPGVSVQGFTGSQGDVGFTGSIGSSGGLGFTGSSGSSELSIETKTNSYTLQLTDSSKVIDLNSASSITATVPSNANVAFPIGTQIIILQSGTGNVTIGNQASVIVNSRLGLKLAGRWAGATVIKTETNSWIAIGDLTT